MKTFFIALFVALLLLSAVAWRIQPKPTSGDKIPLVWVSDDNPARREQIALFNAQNPRHFLQLDPNNGGMEKVIVQSLGGVGPDLFDCGTGYDLSAYVKAEIAWDVTDALKREGIDPANSIWKAVLPNIQKDGRIYGFPTNAASNAIWINRDIFDKAGIPYPKGEWTWQQFIALAQKLTIRDEKGRAKQFGLLCDWWNWSQFVQQWGGSVFNKEGTRCTLDSPEAIAGVQFLHDLIYKYRVMPSPVEESAMATQGGWGSGTITQFGAGKGAMALGGRWWLCTLRSYENLHLTAAESPYYKQRIFRGYGKGTLINRNSPRREEALKFLIYMAKREYNELINAQADGLCPVKKWAQTPTYLNNPQFPQEDYNKVWRDSLEVSEPDPVSPFVNGQIVQRILNKQLDLVKNDQKPVPEALKAAANEINKEILETLKRDPELRARFDKVLQGAAQ